MRKDKLISSAAKGSGYDIWEVKKIANALKRSLHSALLNGETVTISGFGSYKIKVTPAHVRFDSRSQKKVTVPEKRKLIFTPSPKFKFDDLESTKPKE